MAQLNSIDCDSQPCMRLLVNPVENKVEKDLRLTSAHRSSGSECHSDKSKMCIKVVSFLVYITVHFYHKVLRRNASLIHRLLKSGFGSVGNMSIIVANPLDPL